jgi:hypothetical protein
MTTPLAVLQLESGLVLDCETDDKISDAGLNPLDKILPYTPIPTMVLDASLCVVRISKSYFPLFMPHTN